MQSRTREIATSHYNSLCTGGNIHDYRTFCGSMYEFAQGPPPSIPSHTNAYNVSSLAHTLLCMYI